MKMLFTAQLRSTSPGSGGSTTVGTGRPWVEDFDPDETEMTPVNIESIGKMLKAREPVTGPVDWGQTKESKYGTYPTHGLSTGGRYPQVWLPVIGSLIEAAAIAPGAYISHRGNCLSCTQEAQEARIVEFDYDDSYRTVAYGRAPSGCVNFFDRPVKVICGHSGGPHRFGAARLDVAEE